MRRRTSRRLSLASVLAAIMGQVLVPMGVSGQKPGAGGATPRASRAERAVPFAPGEVLTYDVSWSSYLTAGTATVSVKEKKPSNGSVAYYVVAEGRPTPLLSKLYHLYYKVDTLLDAYTLLPQRGSVYSEEGGRKRTKITTFDQTLRKGEFEVQTGATSRRDLVLPASTQDALGAIYVLRAVPLRTGGRLTMAVADEGKILEVRMAIGRVESVKTGIGTVAALRVTPTIVDEEGRSDTRAMDLWISDDARRLPVRLEAELPVGSFVLTLTSANR